VQHTRQGLETLVCDTNIAAHSCTATKGQHYSQSVSNYMPFPLRHSTSAAFCLASPLLSSFIHLLWLSIATAADSWCIFTMCLFCLLIVNVLTSSSLLVIHAFKASAASTCFLKSFANMLTLRLGAVRAPRSISSCCTSSGRISNLLLLKRACVFEQGQGQEI